MAAIALPGATFVALNSSLHASEAHVVRHGEPQAKASSKAAVAPVVPGDHVAAIPDIDVPVDPRDRVLDSRAPRTGRSRMVGPTIGGSIWASQGAAPAQFGQIENVVPDNEVVGAVHALAAHPESADILYLGGVNGGVWKTTNATAMSPTWVPLTDLENGLAIGALEFDPTDVTHQTLVAGIGRYSSFGSAGSFRTGILRTTDGGTTWQSIDGGGVLLNKNISGVAARGGTIVVSVNFAILFEFPEIGIFRSVDGGVTFTQVSTGDGTATGLPSGLSYDLEGDPTSPNTLYTNIVFAEFAGGANGIYKSTNFAATWTKVSDSTMDALIISGVTSNIELSVGSAGQVFVAILNFGQLRHGGVFRSGDGGATWLTMDVPLTNEGGIDVGTNPTFKPNAGEPGGQGAIHFSIQADLSNSNIVYVGGDRQPFPLPNSIGAQDFTGRLFRGDASLPPGNQWVHLTHSNVLGAPGGGTASSSAPHADSREMVFDVNGDLIECDDGGIYRRTFPRSNTGDWFSMIGNLAVTEFHDIAYDHNSKVIIGGTQDNGTLLQNAPGGITWRNIFGGDGGDVAVDDTSRPGFSIRYYSAQFLGGFSRATYDAANNFVEIDYPTLTLIGGGNELGGQFSTPIALSAVDQTRLVIGGDRSVYESLDQGDTIREIGADILVNSTTAGNAMAYGGRLAGVPNPDVLYVGSGFSVFRRTTPGSVLQFAGIPPASGIVRDVVIDPQNWNRIYVITDYEVFVSIDAGTTWSDITGDLTGVQVLRSGEFLTSAGEGGLVVGTNVGVFLSRRTALGTWNRIGTNLPNVPVWDLDYDATDDVLVAGTLGRGAWMIENAGTTILPDCGSSACLGACCFTSSCTDSITEASCLDAGGTWFVGDTCDSVCLGACCDGATCLDAHTAGTCASVGGVFRLGSNCATRSCTGACCESLTCTEALTDPACSSGTWREGEVCNDVCFGACCTGTTCADGITESGCEDGLGGVFFLGDNCQNTFCACVNGVGDCVSLHAGVGCETEECCNAVCLQDSTCCTTKWSSTCAHLARASCAENDNCADALAIQEGITPFDTSMSTTDGPLDCLNGDFNVGTKDIWFVHDAACTGDMTVSLCVNTFYDNTLQIYETAACDPLGVQLDCGDDTCGYGGGPATLTVPIVEGTQYLIRTGGWGDSSGPGEIDLFIIPADNGDDDGDGVANPCDLCPGFDDRIDCQPNGVPDGCDLDDGDPDGDGQVSDDCNGNGVPDECEPDCNGNDVPDDCDIDGSDPDNNGQVSDDCDDNGFPDECDARGGGILLDVDFEAGIPDGWAVTGIFKVTSSCPVLPTCDGNAWAYAGNEFTCTYGDSETGELVSPPIALGPTISELHFCSMLFTETGFDYADVFVNEERVYHEADYIGVWQDHVLDLSAFAGQTVTITFRLTSDGLFSGPIGWQVDDISLVSGSPPQQGCCLPGNTCETRLPECCLNEGGTLLGSESPCTEPEACCMSNGTCRFLDPLCCESDGGSPQGPDSVCRQVEACCLGDGTCQVLDPLCCREQGGMSRGPATVCTVHVCDCDTDVDCDDGDYCNGAESCDFQLGCQAGSPPCTDPLLPQCDEDNQSCVECLSDAHCDDGDFCTGAETCDDATCQSGTPPNCDDDVACTIDSCSSAAAACLHALDHAACNNGVFCDGQEFCDLQSGCLGGPIPCTGAPRPECDEETNACVECLIDAHCDDEVSCTVDSCDEEDHECKYRASDAACDDGDFCNGAETCNATNGCRSGTSPNCDDGVECTFDHCDSQAGACVSDSDDFVCDDGLFCNGSETCDGADGCKEGLAPDCDDAIDTNLDVCDEQTETCKHGDLIVSGESTVFAGASGSYTAIIVFDDGTEQNVTNRANWRVLSASLPGAESFACGVDAGLLSCRPNLYGDFVPTDDAIVGILVEARVAEGSVELVASAAASILPLPPEAGQVVPNAGQPPPSGACGLFGMMSPALLLVGLLRLRTTPYRSRRRAH